MHRRLIRKFVDLYDPAVIERLSKDKTLDFDGRALYNFSMKELKRRVSPDVWSKITAQDPLFKIPELEDVCDIEDVIPHFHSTLPPHLSRPAILLDQRQREAKRMTLEYMRKEKALIEEREKALNLFPVLDTDNYEIFTGLMIVREPIWLFANDKDIEFLKARLKVWNEHGKMANLKSKNFEFEAEQTEFENDRSVRIRLIEKKIANKEDLNYIPLPNSKHYLEADPNENDPKSIGYAGGYRVWLLLKEKSSEKWVFPTMRMVGTQSFTNIRKKLFKENFNKSLEVHVLGPGAVKVDIVNYEEPLILDRPRLLTEDVYDLYFQRLKILFPKAQESELVKYLIKKYDMHKNTQPLKTEVKGKKVFYCRCIYDDGDFKPREGSIYSDWAWVPKLELNKYLNEEDYYKFVTVMTRT